MKKTLFVTVLSAILLGTIVPVLGQTTPAQTTTQSDPAKVKERIKKDQKKSPDGKYMLNPKKAKGKTKQPKAVGEQ